MTKATWLHWVSDFQKGRNIFLIFYNKNVLITAVFCVMFSLKDTFDIKKWIPHFSHSKILVLDIFCHFLLHSEHECHTHIIDQLKKRVCSNRSGPLGPRRTSYSLQAKQTKVKLVIVSAVDIYILAIDSSSLYTLVHMYQSVDNKNEFASVFHVSVYLHAT